MPLKNIPVYHCGKRNALLYIHLIISIFVVCACNKNSNPKSEKSFTDLNRLLYLLKNSRKNFKILAKLNSKIKDQKIQLVNTLEQLEERNREEDRILRIVAHDLRTPAASVSMLTELLLIETDETKKVEMIYLIKNSTKN